MLFKALLFQSSDDTGIESMYFFTEKQVHQSFMKITDGYAPRRYSHVSNFLELLQALNKAIATSC